MDKEVWYQSKTIWASLVVMAIGIMQSLNIGDVGPLSIDAMTTEKETLVESLTQFGILIGGALAMWGRLTAKKQVTLKKEKP